jgi:SEC-C motif-containing protein
VNKKNLCPCGSGRLFKECCRPLHRGEREADTPEALMRARFAAFATGNVDFLVRTLHPEHEDRARPEADVARELRDACRELRYMGLQILETQPARVRFRVKVFHRGKDVSFTELSEFAREGGETGGWRYLRGVHDRSPDAA